MLRRYRSGPITPRQHLDHSCVGREEYDQVLRALGHWRWKARDLEAELGELRKKVRLTDRSEHIAVLAPEPAYGWCAPCGRCHVVPFCLPTEDVEEEAA